MKKIALLIGILLIIGTLIFSAIPCQAFSQIVIGYNLTDSTHGSVDQYHSDWAAEIFTLPGGNNLTAISLRLFQPSGDIGNWQIQIFNVGTVGSYQEIIGDPLQTIQVPSVTTSNSIGWTHSHWYQFPIEPITQVAGQQLAIKLTAVGTWPSNTNSLEWSNESPGTLTGCWYTSNASGGQPTTAQADFQVFSDYIAPGTIETLRATQGPNGLILSGRVTSFGSSNNVDTFFNWGLTTDYGNLATGPILSQTKGPQNFTATIPTNQITAGTTIHYQAFYEDPNTLSSIYGTDYTFTIQSSAGTNQRIETDKATNISYTSATLNGQIFSMGNDSAVDLSFNFGTTPAMTSAITVQSGATELGAYAELLNNLSSNTTYYFQFQSEGSIDGVSNNNNQILSFTTHNPSASGGVNIINDVLNDIGIGSAGWWLLLALLMIGIWLIPGIREHAFVGIIIDAILLGSFIAADVFNPWLVTILAILAGAVLAVVVIRGMGRGD